MKRDWGAWHKAYSEGASPQARRLGIVRSCIREVLDAREGLPTAVTSICAGDGRDILGVLAGRPGASRVAVTLVELDRGLADAAGETAAELGLPAPRLSVADAGKSDTYAGIPRADLLLACGVFGNVPDADIFRTIAFLPALLAPGGSVVWTRHHRAPDLTPVIRHRFAAEGFAEVAFEEVEDSVASVGLHRLGGPPRPFEAGRRLFTFFR